MLARPVAGKYSTQEIVCPLDDRSDDVELLQADPAVPGMCLGVAGPTYFLWFRGSSSGLTYLSPGEVLHPRPPRTVSSGRHRVPPHADVVRSVTKGPSFHWILAGTIDSGEVQAIDHVAGHITATAG